MARLDLLRILSLSLCWLLLWSAIPAWGAVVNRIVLRVNDRIATLYEYEARRTERLEAILRADLDPEERRRLQDQVGEMVLREMFDELLLLSRSDHLAIQISPSQVNAAIGQMRQSYGIETDQEFAAALAQSGMTREELEEQLRRNLRMREVLAREVHARIELKEEDLRRYYREHPEEFRVPQRLRLREVVVLETSGLDREAMLRIARAIREELVAGRALNEAIQGYATQQITSQVIDLGWVQSGDLDRNLEEAVWNLQAGEVSEPVDGRGGIHVIQVVDRQEAGMRTFNEVMHLIEEKEGNRRFQEELQKYLEELRKNSYIVADPPPDATGFLAVVSPSPTEAFGAMEGVGESPEGDVPSGEPSPQESPEADEPPNHD